MRTHIIIFNNSKRYSFLLILSIKTINVGFRVITFHTIHDTTLIHAKTFKRQFITCLIDGQQTLLEDLKWQSNIHNRNWRPICQLIRQKSQNTKLCPKYFRCPPNRVGPTLHQSIAATGTQHYWYEEKFCFQSYNQF